MTKPTVAFWLFVLGFVGFGTYVIATNSTETVISLSTGLKVGGAAADRVGFYDATPTPKPLSNNYAAVNITPLPTAPGTPSTTQFNNAIAQINSATVLVDSIRSGLAAQGLLGTPTPTPTSTPTPTPTPTP